jgi:taurine dioxygenase
MVTKPTIRVSRLSGSLGAAISGVDLAELDDTTFEQIHRAWLEHLVLVFPNQNISPEKHVAFGRRFGEVTVHPLYPGKGPHPEIMELRNRGKALTITENWHSDTTSLPEPPMATINIARVVPEAGGDTMFANEYLAFEGLSPRMQLLLESLNAVHSSASETNTHPVVRTHPETGRRALFVNRYFVKQFEGMTEEESAPLLGYLFEHSVLPEYTFRHRWKESDLIIWDNRCTLHYAIHDYGDAERVLDRINVRGDRPK